MYASNPTCSKNVSSIYADLLHFIINSPYYNKLTHHKRHVCCYRFQNSFNFALSKKNICYWDKIYDVTV